MIKRKNIYYANLKGNKGSEQGGVRPVIILQNDLGNKFSKTVIVVPITSSKKTELPTHVKIEKGKFGIKRNSIVLTEQIITIDKSRLKEKVGVISDEFMEVIKHSIEISIGIRKKTTLKNLIKIAITK